MSVILLSVCIATHNGERFLRPQIESILGQIGSEDEVIIQDDSSNDKTLAMLAEFVDSRLKVEVNSRNLGVVKTIERALERSNGQFVFLADQDDVWLPNKVNIFVDALRSADLVVSDCHVTDSELRITYISFFSLRGSGPGVLKNVWRNSYLGCCMAFRREVLEIALPFPHAVPMHDMWIGLLADAMFRVVFVETPTLLYRRHGGNASPTAEKKNPFGLARKVRYRADLVWMLFKRVLSLKLPGSGLR